MKIRLCYSSIRPVDAGDLIEDLNDILSKARDFNAKHQIYGVLYYANNSFFQCLEGEEEILNDLMQRIMQDPRHHEINVFEAIKSVRKTNKNYDPVVVVACSSAEYGASLTPENTPVKETAALLPLHPYGVSKVGQDLLSFQYYQNDKIRCIRARIFNTTGPRKTNDVVADFTHRAVDIERKKIAVLKVGNLKTKRAITDVRDLVNALMLLSDKGTWGDVYNMSGNKVYEINEIVPIIENYMGIHLATEVDPKLLRPTDEPIIYGDSSKLKNDTGWEQQYPLEQTIKDMIDYIRNKS